MSEEKSCNNCKHLGTDCAEIVGMCSDYIKWVPKAEEERNCKNCFSKDYWSNACESCSYADDSQDEHLNWKPFEPAQVEVSDANTGKLIYRITVE